MVLGKGFINWQICREFFGCFFKGGLSSEKSLIKGSTVFYHLNTRGNQNGMTMLSRHSAETCQETETYQENELTCSSSGNGHPQSFEPV